MCTRFSQTAQAILCLAGPCLEIVSHSSPHIFVFMTIRQGHSDGSTIALRHVMSFFTLFNKECSRHVTLSEYLSLDGTLHPTRNQLAFKKYNPDKVVNYGMLFKSLNDARHSCMYRLLIYAGKPNKLPSPYYVAGTQNYIKELVTSVEKSTCLQGNISMDCLYMSIPIAKLLLGKKTSSVLVLSRATRLE